MVWQPSHSPTPPSWNAYIFVLLPAMTDAVRMLVITILNDKRCILTWLFPVACADHLVCIGVVSFLSLRFDSGYIIKVYRTLI